MAARSTPITVALNQIRDTVAQILDEGDDPGEVLALGTLVRNYAPEGTDLARLRDSLEHSTLGETVAIAADQQRPPDDEQLDADELPPPSGQDDPGGSR